MDYSHLITVEPGKRSGQPCVRGMRITVRDVLEYLAGGMTVDDLLADFPELTPENVRACLAYAAAHGLAAEPRVADFCRRAPARYNGTDQDRLGTVGGGT